MAELDDEIARIAALRGKPVNYYTERAEARREGYELHANTIAAIFSPHPDPRRDLRAYDRLPAEVRTFVSESTLQLNASAIAGVAQEISPERLITTIQAHMPGQVRAWVQRHYGRGHPALRRIA